MRSTITKRRRITIRNQEVNEQDWRGLIAILTTVGFFAVSTAALFRYSFGDTIATVAMLSTTETLVLNWYFKSKE